MARLMRRGMKENQSSLSTGWYNQRRYLPEAFGYTSIYVRSFDNSCWYLLKSFNSNNYNSLNILI